MLLSGFNPNARWDRNIEGAYDDPDKLKAKIQVLAFFSGAKVYPRIFMMSGKRYRIRKLNYTWQKRQGSELISCFSVSTACDIYQLSFNHSSCAWKLDNIF